MYPAQCSVYHAQCIELSVPCSVYRGQCTELSGQCTVYHAVFSVWSSVYSVSCCVQRIELSVSFSAHGAQCIELTLINLSALLSSDMVFMLNLLTWFSLINESVFPALEVRLCTFFLKSNGDFPLNLGLFSDIL